MMTKRLHFLQTMSIAQGRLFLVTLLLTLLVGAAHAQEEQPEGPPIPPVEILKQEATPDGVNMVIQIPVSKDSYLSSAFPNTSFGGLTTSKIGYESGGDEAMRIVLQFDLSSIPANVTINSAQFRYYLIESRPPLDAPMGFKAQYLNTPWNEYGVTWNNANYLGGPTLEIGEVPGTVGWHTNDGTAAVRAWYSGARTNHGVIITGDEAPQRNRSRLFYTREATATFYPQLIVDYTISCDTLPPAATVQALPSFSPGSFQVKWSGTDTAPSGCSPTGIAYYDVQYRVNGGGWVAWKNQTTATTATFTSGQNGSLYEFQVRAVDQSGNAQSFGSAQASTRVDSLPPSAEVLDLPPFTYASSFSVQWTGGDNLSGIAAYDVQWRTAGGIWQTLVENTTQTVFHFTGGQHNVTYEFRARARDFVGNVQPFSDLAQTQTTVVIQLVASVLPFDQPILKPTEPITDSFMVSWSFDSGPTTPDETRVYYRYNGGAWTLWDVFDYPQLSAQFPWQAMGLADGLYEFEAVAVNSFGQIEPINMQAEAVIWVDMADAVQARARLPILISNK